MPNGTQESSKPIAAATEAINTAKEQLSNAADVTEAKVREFPLAAVGLAFGAGVVAGAVGYALLRREQTWRDRIEDADVGRRLSKLLHRFI